MAKIVPGRGKQSGDAGSPRKQEKTQLGSREKPLGSARVCSADFGISWKALRSRSTPGGFSGFAVSITQRIRRKSKQQMWKAVAIHCDDDVDGGLIVRVSVCNPDWERPMQIAELRSRPDDVSCLTPLACNLDQIENEKA